MSQPARYPHVLKCESAALMRPLEMNTAAASELQLQRATAVLLADIHFADKSTNTVVLFVLFAFIKAANP